MLSKSLRAALLVGTLSLIGLGGGPLAAASAAVESSRITSPASPTYALFDETQPAQHAFTVTGTTNVVGNIALRCYYGVGPNESWLVVKEVTPSGGSFAVEVDTDALYDGPCVLRAVPASDAKAYPPGSPSEEASDPFQGPVIVGSHFEVASNDEVDDYYDFEVNSLSAYLEIESAGSCGLTESNLYAPSSLLRSADLFGCNAAFFKEDDPPSGAATRSDLQVDGANAYTPTTARYLAEGLATTIPGAPRMSVTQVFDPSTGLIRIDEVDPLVKCSPETIFPPTQASCKEFVSTGVQLERTWRTSDSDQVASMTDSWSSTDGDAHALSALYEQWWGIEDKAGGAFEFPGSGTFAPTTTGEAVSLPAGAGAIDYREDAATPAGGDGEHPQGAIVYDRAPSEPATVYEGSGAGKVNADGTEFNMPYEATIPASGTYALRMGFVQAYALSEVQTLTEAVEASFAPTLSIAAPPSGTIVGTPSVTVSGAASDTGALSSLTVAGHAVGVGTGGAWSTSVALSPGANTIIAVATDQAGFSTSRQISVSYVPMYPAPPPAHASQVGSSGGSNGKVTFTLACTGSAGTSCEVRSSLTTVEKLRGGKPIAVSARRHRQRTRSRRVSVGASQLTIPPGRRATIAIVLNAAGKRLLAKFGRLPVHLSVVLVNAGQRSTIVAQNLTVKLPNKVKKQHKRHHRRR